MRFDEGDSGLIVPARKFICSLYGPLGFGAGGGGGVAAVTFIGSNVDPTGGISHSFSAEPIGPDVADREVVIGASGINGAGGATITGVTIDGVSMDPTVAATADGDTLATMWQKSDVSGTTANIVVTHSVTNKRCGISVYNLNGANSAAADTATDDAGDALTVSLNIPENGVAIGYATGIGSSNPTYTWTGLDEDADEPIENQRTHTSASKFFATQQTGLGIDVNGSVTLSNANLVGASWGPA